MFAPVDAVLALLYPYVHVLVSRLDAALVVVILTIVVRVLLVPVSIRQVRAQARLRAVVARVADLRSRLAGDPERLTREVRWAYADAGVSPWGVLGTGLLQAPVLLLLYRLCSAPVVGGVPNELLTATLLGVPLSARWIGVGLGPESLAFVLLLVVALLVALWSSRLLRRVDAEAPVVLRLLPYGVAVSVAFVPLAVGVYLVTSAAWSVGERLVFSWMGVG